jgi:hypothetical protein
MVSRLDAPVIPKEKEGLISKFSEEIKDKFSRIANREVKILNPLSLSDWKHWYEIIKVEKESIGFVQFLPVGYKSAHPFRNNLMQVLPKQS